MSPAIVRRARLPILFAVGVWLVGCTDGPTAVPPEGAVDLALPWLAADPESVGLDGTKLFVAGELAGRIDRVRSLLVVREGRLAFERYYGGWTADTLADVRSVTKSVVSILVGAALDDGRIDGLDQPITDFLPGSRYGVRVDHAFVTVGHLLTMTGGFDWAELGGAGYDDWIVSADPVEYLLDRAITDPPGSTFRYNSAAVHLLGVILEEATGMPLPQYADRTLFEPLGIGRREWEPSSGGHVNGGSGLDLRPRDLARLGQLMLQEGWSGRRSIMPGSWIEEATTRRFADLGPVGPIDRLSYGYLWWVDLEHEAFLAWGFGGQFVYVVPALDLVVVATTDWRGVRGDIGPERLQEEVLGIIVDRVLGAVQ